MKTSNYIIIAFFVFIFGAMLWLFIAAKNHKGKEEIWNKSTYVIPNFSVIVAEPNAKINITQGDSNKLIINYKNDEIEAKNSYRINNDTLFAKSETNSDIFGITVSVGNLSMVIAKAHSRVDIQQLQSGNLSAKVDHASIVYWGAEKPKSDTLELNISVMSKNSDVSFDGINANKIEIYADSTDILFSGKQNVSYKTDTFIVKMRNKSDIRIYGTISNLAIERDSTSRIIEANSY